MNITEHEISFNYRFYSKLANSTSIKNKKNYDYYVGIEFENELKHEVDLCLPNGWTAHTENSLKYNGYEFVSRKGLRKSAVEKSVKELFDSVTLSAGGKFQPTNSIRTSTHFHFNQSENSLIDTILFSTVYWIMEPFIQYFCGPHRQYNHFCLRLNDSKIQKLWLADSIRSRQLFYDGVLGDKNIRYGSWNLQSMAKFRTLESRLMRGVSNPDDAIIWFNVLDKIKAFAESFPSTIELQDFFLNSVSAEEFPVKVLGEELFSYLEEYFPTDLSISNEIRKGYLNVLVIFKEMSIYTVDTLEKIEKTMQKITQKEEDKSLKEIAQATKTAGVVSSTLKKKKLTSSSLNPANAGVDFATLNAQQVINTTWNPANSSATVATKAPSIELFSNCPCGKNSKCKKLNFATAFCFGCGKYVDLSAHSNKASQTSPHPEEPVTFPFPPKPWSEEEEF
jgi:hypothetical protein